MPNVLSSYHPDNHGSYHLTYLGEPFCTAHYKLVIVIRDALIDMERTCRKTGALALADRARDLQTRVACSSVSRMDAEVIVSAAWAAGIPLEIVDSTCPVYLRDLWDGIENERKFYER